MMNSRHILLYMFFLAVGSSCSPSKNEGGMLNAHNATGVKKASFFIYERIRVSTNQQAVVSEWCSQKGYALEIVKVDSAEGYQRAEQLKLKRIPAFVLYDEHSRETSRLEGDGSIRQFLVSHTSKGPKSAYHISTPNSHTTSKKSE